MTTCKALTSKGVRCKNKGDRTGYCWLVSHKAQRGPVYYQFSFEICDDNGFSGPTSSRIPSSVRELGIKGVREAREVLRANSPS